MVPLGKNVLVSLLPEPPRSAILITDGIAPERITRRATVKATGALVQHVSRGETVLVRTTLGVQCGNYLLVPEEACVATIND